MSNKTINAKGSIEGIEVYVVIFWAINSNNTWNNHIIYISNIKSLRNLLLINFGLSSLALHEFAYGSIIKF